MLNDNLVSYTDLGDNNYKLQFELDANVNCIIQNPNFQESAGDIILINTKIGYKDEYKFYIPIAARGTSSASLKKNIKDAKKKIEELKNGAPISRFEYEREIMLTILSTKKSSQQIQEHDELQALNNFFKKQATVEGA